MWAYLLLHLCREVRIFTESGLTDFGKFYSEVSDWKHDSQIFILLIMFNHGIILDFSKYEGKEQLTLEENAINLL